jgi:tripartite-type tricarboxylate transporter receptor subunit TctC
VIAFYVDAFKKTMSDPQAIEQHKKAGLSLHFMDNKELAELIKQQEKFAKEEVSQLYK